MEAGATQTSLLPDPDVPITIYTESIAANKYVMRGWSRFQVCTPCALCSESLMAPMYRMHTAVSSADLDCELCLNSSVVGGRSWTVCMAAWMTLMLYASRQSVCFVMCLVSLP